MVFKIDISQRNIRSKKGENRTSCSLLRRSVAASAISYAQYEEKILKDRKMQCVK
jgi:hypothetical protein